MSATSAASELLPGKSRLAVLLEHFAHPLHELLLLVFCATAADCDEIADWARRIGTCCASTSLTRTAFPAGAG